VAGATGLDPAYRKSDNPYVVEVAKFPQTTSSVENGSHISHDGKVSDYLQQ
jgi:hypothetical protein